MSTRRQPSLFDWSDVRSLEAERERLAGVLKAMREAGRRGRLLRTEGRLQEVTERILRLTVDARRTTNGTTKGDIRP